MGNIKIILNKDLSSLGEEGDIKIVKRGYARNYLFPNDIAYEYSKDNIKILESKKEYLEKRKLEKKENARKLKEKLETEKIKIEIPAGEKGRLYGTVTTNNITEELSKLDYNIDKRKIDLKEHIKFGGTYKYTIHLYQDINAEMQIEVIAKYDKPEPKGKKGKKYNKKRHNEIEQTPEDTKQEQEQENTIETKE